jgi:hypothetical protein
MANAQCACGALRLTCSRPPQLTALCHCLACQRRTGAPFGANAFFSVECIEIFGPRQNLFVSPMAVAKSVAIFARLVVRPCIGRQKPRRLG